MEEEKKVVSPSELSTGTKGLDKALQLFAGELRLSTPDLDFYCIHIEGTYNKETRKEIEHLYMQKGWTVATCESHDEVGCPAFTSLFLER